MRLTPKLNVNALRVCAAHLALVGASTGCDWSAPPSEVATLGQARPQAITYLDDQTLAVSDVAYRAGRWGEGRVVFLNPQTGERYGSWFTPITNPQRLRVIGDLLAVVSSGEIDLSGEPRGGWSALSVLDLEQPLNGAHSVAWRAEPLGSFLVDVVSVTRDETSSAQHFELTSGLDGTLWRLSPRAGIMTNAHSSGSSKDAWDALSSVRYAPLGSLSLSALQRWDARTLLVDFNTDLLTIFNPEGEPVSCNPEIGAFVGVMEGAQTPRVEGDRLWVSFGLSGRLIEVDLSSLELDDPDCEPLVKEYDPPLGQVPNDLLVTATQVYVLHTAENAIWVYDRESQRRQSVWPLPAQTSPWGFALNPAQDTLAVTEWARGGVTLLNAYDGSILRSLPESALAPPPPPRCEWSVKTSAGALNQRAISTEGEIFSWSALSMNGPTQGERTARSLDLQGAPQLAILLAPNSAPIKVEVKTSEASPWREVSDVRFITSSSESPRELNVSADVWSARESPLELAPLINGLSSNERDDTDLSSLALSDPCSLFSPDHDDMRTLRAALSEPVVARLSLTGIDPISDTSDEVPWGGAHPSAGRIPLSQARISSSDPARPALIWAVAYRSW